jgi:hypothetical protein
MLARLYTIPAQLFKTYTLGSGRQETAMVLGTAFEHKKKKAVDF